MPKIADAIKPVDTRNMDPVNLAEGSGTPPLPSDQEQRNPFLRSPLPSINSSPDSLRQFYGPGIPQFRVMPPPTPSVQAIKGDTGAQGAQGPAGSAATSKSNGVQQQIIPVTTASIANNATANGNVHLGYEFTVYKVTVSAACRVRIYTTSAGRTADASRTVYFPPDVFNQHGVILDVIIDSSMVVSLGPLPVTWVCSPEAPGFDGSQYQTGDIAYAITNLSGSTTPITVTFYIYRES